MSESKKTYEDILDQYGKLVYKNIGTSMMPLLRQNRDLMVIEKKKIERCKKYDAVLYKRPNGKYVLHRIIKVRKSDYVICGDHCYRKEYGITDGQIIGVLKAVVRDGKTISVDDRKYLLYVHLWCDLFYIRAAILVVKRFSYGVVKKLFRGDKNE